MTLIKGFINLLHNRHIRYFAYLGISLLILLFNILITDPNKNKAQVEAQTLEVSNEPKFVSNQLLIKFKKNSHGVIKEGKPGDTGIKSLNAKNNVFRVKEFKKIAKENKKSSSNQEIFDWYVVTLDTPERQIKGKLEKEKGVIASKNSADILELQEYLSQIRKEPSVEDIELNYVVATTAVPNDPYYSSSSSWGQAYDDLYGMKKINTASAWDQATGSASIIVASIDTGVDRNHEDLSSNMWVNPAETPDNGIDDDGNGYIDDIHGWDWINSDNDPMDDHGHGTHTAGTIGAVGNNTLGVVGVNWTVKIMALKFLNSAGSGSIVGGIQALQYAADMGAKVSSNSWGCTCSSSALNDAVTYEHDRGMITVSAAGNDNTDALDFSPASTHFTITVAASDSNDAKASFSNWGEKIDVAAPGVDILSTRSSLDTLCEPRGTVVATNYCRLSGTSMATPHVSGLVALLLSKNPGLTNEEIRQIIRAGSDDLGIPGKDSSFGFGRINANGSVSLPFSPLTPFIASPTKFSTLGSVSIPVVGGVGGANFANYKLEQGMGRSPSTWTIINESTTQVTNGTLGTFDYSGIPDGTYTIRLTATDTNGQSFQFQTYDVVVDNLEAAISSPYSLASQNVNIVGTANGLAFDHYILDWGQGPSPETYSTEGISLANGGIQTVVQNTLGNWDTSLLINGQIYTLRLRTYSTTGGSDEYKVKVTIDHDLVSGWPKSFPGTQDMLSSLTDINNDGTKEIVVVDGSGKIHALNRDGSILPGFPRLTDPNDQFVMPATVDDLDNDGQKEIVAISMSYQNITPDQYPKFKIYITKSDGTAYPGWPNPEFVYRANGYHTPTLVDIDDDTIKDLIFVDYDGNLHAMKLDGSEITGFPVNFALQSPFIGTPSVADLDNDGEVEIAFGNDTKFYLYNKNGTLLPGWPFTTTPDGITDIEFRLTPSSGDIDGDGIKEIFIIGVAGTSGGSPAWVYGWKKDGTLLSGWPKKEGAWYITYQNSPSMVDIDGDGDDELIAGLDILTIFDLVGKRTLPTTPTSRGSSAITDLDGNGDLELSTGQISSTLSFVNTDGSTYWQKILNISNPLAYFAGTPLVADLDNNGKMEVAINSPLLITHTSDIFLWEIPGANAQYEWPTFNRDVAHTGRIIVSPVPTSVPTSTPTPTNVPTPTNTPTPTLTPTPTPDIINPNVSITSPINNSTVQKNKITIIQTTATDNVGITRVEFFVNNVLKCTTGTAPYTCSWAVPAKPNVIYNLTAKAFDAANNSSTSTNVKVTAK